METSTNPTVLADWPAYRVIAPSEEIPEFKAGDVVRLGRDYLRAYRFGSVRSYANRYDEDPDAAVDLASKLGHNLVWLNPEASALTSHPEEKREFFGLQSGQRVRFEGVIYLVNLTPSGHVQLIG